jgi:hypothetical protein
VGWCAAASEIKNPNYIYIYTHTLFIIYLKIID